MPYIINLGPGGMLVGNRIMAVARARSAPVKRLLQALEPDRVIYLTYGYPRESVVLLDNGFVAVVSLTVEELIDRLYRGTDVF